MSSPLYCSGKYQSAAPDCKADALCKWNKTSSECTDDEDLAYLVADRLSEKVKDIYLFSIFHSPVGSF